MDHEYAQIIVKRIQSLCEERGLSIYKLAEMSGLKQTTIDSIVNGRSLNPQAKTLHKIANGFSMTFAEFMDYPEMNNYSFEDSKKK